AEGRESFPDQLFIREGAVDLGSIEEGDAALDRGAQHVDPVLLVNRRAVAEAQPHAPESEGGDLEAAVAQFACLHFAPLRGDSFRLVGNGGGRPGPRYWYTRRVFSGPFAILGMQRPWKGDRNQAATVRVADHPLAILQIEP